MLEKLDPKTDGSSKDIVQDNIQQLKQLFPDVFAENKVDFDALRSALGDYVESADERYSFNWHGKVAAKRIAQTPSTGTLLPCKEESKDWDTTENLFIEGDNLEVLKLLQKSYHKQVKMIYIDPPYNTGKEFIYPDNYQDNLDTYLEYTGQKDNEGRKFGTNTETTGRYHTNWLNMMYPRLKLARNLLRDDGVIFISIDDHEQSNLQKICDEILGEENCLGIIANINNPKGRSDDNFFATAHEYLLVYGKNLDKTNIHGFEPEAHIIKRYNKTDQNGKYYREIDLRKTGDSDRRIDRQDMFYYFYYEIENNSFRVSKEKDKKDREVEIIPLREDGIEGRWRWGFETAKENISSLFPKFMPTRKIWGIFEKDYLEGRSAVKPTTAWTFKDVNSERGSEQFIDLGFKKEVFPRPKPLGTLLRVLEIGTLPNEESIVLDFFAGSGGFAQAVYQLNSENKRNLKYILVQLPELISETKKEEKEAYDFCVESNFLPYITSISKERLHRAGEKIKADNASKEGIKNLDIGFKVFKLASSNIKPWDADIDQLEQGLFDSVDNIKNDRTAEDVLYELLLKYGIDLTIPIETHSIADKTVYSVGLGALVVCLDDVITLDVIEGIGKLKEQLQPEVKMHVVLKDVGLKDDVVKTNAIQILKRYDIQDVKTL